MRIHASTCNQIYHKKFRGDTPYTMLEEPSTLFKIHNEIYAIEFKTSIQVTTRGVGGGPNHMYKQIFGT